LTNLSRLALAAV
jgi:hypothetical protein